MHATGSEGDDRALPAARLQRAALVAMPEAWQSRPRAPFVLRPLGRTCPDHEAGLVGPKMVPSSMAHTSTADLPAAPPLPRCSARIPKDQSACGKLFESDLALTRLVMPWPEDLDGPLEVDIRHLARLISGSDAV